MSEVACQHEFPEGIRCTWEPKDHIHQPAATCERGHGHRHHEFTVASDHMHRFFCACGALPTNTEAPE